MALRGTHLRSFYDNFYSLKTSATKNLDCKPLEITRERNASSLVVNQTSHENIVELFLPQEKLNQQFALRPTSLKMTNGKIIPTSSKITWVSSSDYNATQHRFNMRSNGILFSKRLHFSHRVTK